MASRKSRITIEPTDLLKFSLSPFSSVLDLLDVYESASPIRKKDIKECLETINKTLYDMGASHKDAGSALCAVLKQYRFGGEVNAEPFLLWLDLAKAMNKKNPVRAAAKWHNIYTSLNPSRQGPILCMLKDAKKSGFNPGARTRILFLLKTIKKSMISQTLDMETCRPARFLSMTRDEWERAAKDRNIPANWFPVFARHLETASEILYVEKDFRRFISSMPDTQNTEPLEKALSK